MLKIKQKPHKLVMTALFIAIGLLLFGTDPNELPLPLLILPFILLFLLIFLGTLFIFQQKTHSLKLFTNRSVTVAMTVAILPVLLVVFQSIHQLTFKDVLVSFALLGGILFYISKTNLINP
jgi:hypothetical protein